MHIRKFQEKLVRRVASPVEIVYAVSSHWFLIFLCAAICTFAILVQVVNEPVIYSSRATVILESPQAVLQTRRGYESRDEGGLTSQARIFQSPAVVEATIKALGYDVIDPKPDSDGSEKPERGISGFFRSVSKKFDELRKRVLSENTKTVFTEEDRINRQVHAFRARSTVTSLRNTNHVLLQLRGQNPDNLERELHAWIKTYRSVLKQLTAEGISPFLAESVERWQRLADDAKVAIEKFTDEHGNANPAMYKYYQEKVIRKQLDIDRLKLQLETAMASENQETKIVQTQIVHDELVTILEDRLRGLELQRVELRGNYPEQGKMLEDHDQKIAVMQSRIEELKRGAKAVPAEEIDVSSTLDLLNRSIEKETNELEDLRRTQAQIENELSELDELKRDYQFKVTKRNAYHERTLYTEELQAGRNVMVRVLNPPRVDFAPIPTKKEMKIAVGALGGIAVGLALAFFMELLCRRVRFKKDVVEELGLDVVGVLPGK